MNRLLVESDHAEQYAHPLRIESLTEQLRQISFTGARSVLEIGPAYGLLGLWLQGLPSTQHISVDIEPRLEPNVVSSVLDLPFSDNSFDVAVCGQVLEHLPFEAFAPALRELRRVTRGRVILSLPDKRRRFGIAVCLARTGWHRLELNYSRGHLRRRPFEFDGHHHWEIGYRGTMARDIRAAFVEADLILEREYRLDRHEWHCFFLLRPRGSSTATST